MKKLIYAILLLLPFTIYGQNGGQLNENSVIKIDYIGYSNGEHHFKVTNKQSCSVNTQYTVVGSSQITDTVVGGNGCYYIHIPSQLSEIKTTKARSRQFCPNTSPDQGWVEEDNILNSLPIKFEYINVRKIDSKTIEVEFLASDTDGEDRFNIQVSTDARTFKTVAIVFPEPIVVNKVYNIKVKIR